MTKPLSIETRSSDTTVVLGVILERLFSLKAGDAVAGRPRLAQVLRMTEVANVSLAELGVDSLSWMEMLTTIETDLEIEIGSELVVYPFVSAGAIAQAVTRAMARRSLDLDAGHVEAA